MKIIVAQGNPGPDYRSTRHNAGFLVIDEFAEKHRINFLSKSKFHADIAELSEEGEKVLLVKPTTFYNDTGRSVRSLVDFYKIDPAADLLVIHDDLSLPFGTIRTRQKGSDAGNNGIKSINAAIGADYHRIRIGISNDLREHMGDADFVLSRFSAEETKQLTEFTKKATDSIDDFILDKLDLTTIS